MFWRKRKPTSATQIEIRAHQKALKLFISNRTSIGMSGSSGDLVDAQNAMRFFAYEDRTKESK